MPLMESGDHAGSPVSPLHSSLDNVDGDFRPRSGSTGIRGLFSKDKHRKKSGDESSKGNSPSTSSKVKNFFDSIRPRSKSDLSGVKKPNKKAIQAAKLEASMDESQLTSALHDSDYMNRVPDDETPMGKILGEQLMVAQFPSEAPVRSSHCCRSVS